MKTLLVVSLILSISLLAGNLRLNQAVAESTSIMELFDHDAHLKSFKSFECSHCHNFTVDPKTNKAIPTEGLKESTLKITRKAICHECHQGTLDKWSEAPKECHTCHQSTENMVAIKPANHKNIAWKTSHALNAKVDNQSCLNCHSNSTCVQCHQRRNDVELSNHSRNFRFIHSIVARGSPQKCDACHTKSWCASCHQGR